jgi:hypothetical protein
MGRWSETAKVVRGGGDDGGGTPGMMAPADTSLRTKRTNEQIPAPLPASILPCEQSEQTNKFHGGAPEPGDGACPRCAELDAAARQVLVQLKAHPALPAALRGLPPERLGILLKWAILSLTNPRPQWPPRPPTAAQRRHRPGLDGPIESLGGRPAGAEPPPPEELDDNDEPDG